MKRIALLSLLLLSACDTTGHDRLGFENPAFGIMTAKPDDAVDYVVPQAQITSYCTKINARFVYGGGACTKRLFNNQTHQSECVRVYATGADPLIERQMNAQCDGFRDSRNLI